MGFLKILAYLLPLRIGRRREPDPASMKDRILSNRRDSQSGLLLLGDVIENVRDEWVGATRRVPPNSGVLRDDENHYRGYVAPVKKIRR